MNEQFTAYIEANKDRFLEELSALLRVPSVSAQGRGINEAAEMVKHRLEQLGVQDARILTNLQSAPVVYGTLGSGSSRLLIYDHYDVQPPEPLDQWDSPPFEPTIRDGKLYARGASDNKGNLMMRIQTIEAWLATMGDLPCSIAFVIEGEEEIGSSMFPAVCSRFSHLLKADGCLWETGDLSIDERPVVGCGVKGMLYVELSVRGASRDLHSMMAPIVRNPAWRLVWALSTLKDRDGQMLLQGFTDQMRQPSEADLKALESIPDTDDALLEAYGLRNFLGKVRGIERLRRLIFEPTCTICGLVSGYTGPGSKTVLPSEARAKVDFRLVPDMDPRKIHDLLYHHLNAHSLCDVAIDVLTEEHPARTPLDAPVVQASFASARETYGVEPVVYPMMPGTGPMHTLCQAFGTPAVTGAGCGYSGSQIHAPNENIRLADYWKGMEWMARFLHEFGGRHGRSAR